MAARCSAQAAARPPHASPRARAAFRLAASLRNLRHIPFIAARDSIAAQRTATPSLPNYASVTHESLRFGTRGVHNSTAYQSDINFCDGNLLLCSASNCGELRCAALCGGCIPPALGEMSPNSIPKYLKRPLWRERKCLGCGAAARDRGTAARAPVARRPPRAPRIPLRLPPNLFSRDTALLTTDCWLPTASEPNHHRFLAPPTTKGRTIPTKPDARNRFS
ncbi:unnamed protein product [Pieris brassicae]|uniref:Uncharacterized protein n=1 Tax=Pieris brassicae TaxID=7116 RepID=A0A9P0XFB6_PIEBR|nr:unnamed protein product [Pieris brassicae]